MNFAELSIALFTAQFLVQHFADSLSYGDRIRSPARVAAFVAGAAARGVELKWFGAADPQGFTSRYAHWQYANPTPLPQTDRVLAGLIDMRLPLTFSESDVAQIARIIAEEVASAARSEVLEPVTAPMAD